MYLQLTVYTYIGQQIYKNKNMKNILLRKNLSNSVLTDEMSVKKKQGRKSAKKQAK